MNPKSLLTVFLILFFATSSFAQNRNMDLSFSAKNALTSNALELQGVYVENLTRNCDTLLIGPSMTLSVALTSINDPQIRDALNIKNCYPNPFTGATQFSVYLKDRKSVKVRIISTQGSSLAEFESKLDKGTHSFMITGLKQGFYFLNISDGSHSSTQKLLCQQEESHTSSCINYLGLNDIDKKSYKTGLSNSGFVFLPGDQLRMTAFAYDFTEKVQIDNPSSSESYEFNMDPVDVVFNEIHENFDGIDVDYWIDIPHWYNFWEAGLSSWMGRQYYTEKYAEATSYQSTEPEEVTWLITPLIDFDVNTNEVLTFNSSQAYWTHDGLSVWFIQNFDWPNISFVKTPISCILAGENTPYHEWVSSGVVSLSSYSGLGRIGFRYEGCNWDNHTTTYRIDDIEVYNSNVFVCGSSFTDSRDGQSYTTVQIGNQCWMKENLAYQTSNSWLYDNSSYWEEYGRLYTWSAALNACPSGWHLPSDDEWKTLESDQGMSPYVLDNTGFRGYDVGGKLKEPGLAHWGSPNTMATNSSGFTAFAAGHRTTSGDFFSLKAYTHFWTTTETSSTEAHARGLFREDGGVNRDVFEKANGFSVRCLKD